MTTRITINGKTYEGSSFVQKGNTLIVDGVVVDTGSDKNITVTINGNPEKVTVSSGDVTVNGYVNGSVQSASGSIKVDGDIQGNATAVSGSIKVQGNILGSVSTVSGSIKQASVSKTEGTPF